MFDVGAEKLIVFPLPKCTDGGYITTSSMGIRDSLCVCNISNHEKIELWIMKEYGVAKTWTKELSIHNDSLCTRFLCDDFFEPITFMANETVLMIMTSSGLIYYNLLTGGYKRLSFQVEHGGSKS